MFVVWWQPPFKLIYPKLLLLSSLPAHSFFNLLHFVLILSINMLHLSVKWAFFFRTHCTENHLSIECRESSATSVFLEVDFDSFLSLMNFLYFRVVSGNTLFFHLPWSQSFCSGWSENCAYRPADLKENWYGALLEFFFFFFLSIICLLVWQVQKPEAGLNSAKQIQKCI